jgi:hypothetical protein
MTNTEQLKQQANNFIQVVNQIEIENAAAIKSKESLEKTIKELMENNKENSEALDIATHALEILGKVSDEAVGKAYKFLEQSLNSALAKMFTNTTRKIELKESMRSNQYPQLEIILHVGNGKVRSLKSDSGHGLAQIVSLLSILSLIVITGSRRILVMDEVISGLSVRNRQIVSDILWTFTEIGFQFIVNDHGFVPIHSKVYHLEMVGDVSSVKQSYIAEKGVYLQSDGEQPYNYEEQKEELDNIIRESGGTVDNKSTNTVNSTGSSQSEVLSI